MFDRFGWQSVECENACLDVLEQRMKSERKYSKHNELLISEPSGDANNLPLIHQGRHLSARQTALQCRGKYQKVFYKTVYWGGGELLENNVHILVFCLVFLWRSEWLIDISMSQYCVQVWLFVNMTYSIDGCWCHFPVKMTQLKWRKHFPHSWSLWMEVNGQDFATVWFFFFPQPIFNNCSGSKSNTQTLSVCDV